MFGSANDPLECLLSCFLNMAKSFSLVFIFSETSISYHFVRLVQ